jgi:Fe-S-cluster containining protein
VETDGRTDDGSDTANIHLQMLGEVHVVEVPIPQGSQPVGGVLPAARELTHQITARAVAAANRDGRTVSCRVGCGACCRQLVAISLPDAQSLAKAVSRMPTERQVEIRRRFTEAIARLEAAGLLDPLEPHGNRHLIQPDSVNLPGRYSVAYRYFQQKIACPFLENESCGIYEDRPLVCREYLVTSPAEDCAKLYELPIARVEVPVHMTDVLIQLSSRVADVPTEAIPLVLALEWAEHHPEALAREHDGLELLQKLVAATEEEYRNTAAS